MRHLPWTIPAVLLLAAGSSVAQQTLYTLYGDAGGDKYGYAVRTAGDIDADGYPDFIVGAAFDQRYGSRCGTARIYSGRNGAVLFDEAGVAGDEFGYSVDGVGDVDADGYDDFIVGVLAARTTFRGFAHVYSGRTRTVLYTVAGVAAYDYLGISVGGAGDVNADGYDDFLIGIPGRDDKAYAAGAVQVYSGRNGALLYDLLGDGDSDSFGWFVRGAGDVDADGHSDFIVGAPSSTFGQNNKGYARVFSGRTGAILYTFPGRAAGDKFGWAASGAGDVDGDDRDDLIVGAHLNDDHGADSGSARVFSGATGAVLHTFLGDSAGDRFGWTVDGAGDIDGDGHADLIVGAHLDDDNGDACGSARIFSGRTGAVLYTMYGQTAGDWFGFSVGRAGDVNRDGYADVIIGATFDDGNGPAAGSARVLSLAGVGTPPKTRYRGAGCHGSDGRQPRIEVRGRAAIGESYTVRLRGGLPSATAFLNIGVPVDISLAPLAPGCVIFPYPLLTFNATTDGGGLAEMTSPLSPIPNIPGVIGAGLEHQWIVLDATNNALGVSTSNAVVLVIGQ